MTSDIRHLLGLVIVSLLLTISTPANAKSVPFTVSGYGYAGGTSDGLNLSAGVFSAFSAAPDGPAWLGNGTVGVPMTLSWSSLPFPGPDNTIVHIGGNFTDILFGGIIFKGTFTVPASALITGTFTTQVSVSGELQAFKDLTLGTGSWTLGPLIATLVFGGQGTATFSLEAGGNGSFLIDFANVTFQDSGTLTVAPEPASLLLFATGSAGLALLWKRRRNFVHLAGGPHF